MRGVQPGDTGRGPHRRPPVAYQEPPRTTGPPPILINMRRFQQILDVGKTRAFALVAEGAVETVMLGGRRMVIHASVERFVERLRQQQEAAA